jgi:hypothetical protein
MDFHLSTNWIWDAAKPIVWRITHASTRIEWADQSRSSYWQVWGLAEAIYVGRCSTHHKFDVIGSNGLDNTRSCIVDGKGGGIVPTHEPDEMNEDLHSQVDIAQFCIVLVTDVAACSPLEPFFWVRSVIVTSPTLAGCWYAARGSSRVWSSTRKERSPSMKARGSPKILRTGLLRSRWPTFWAHSLRR